MQRPGLIIFDCDGVLVNTEPIVQRVLSEWLTQSGWPMTPEESVRTIKGSHIDEIQARLEALTGRPHPGFVAGYRRGMFEAFEAGVEAISGADTVLQALGDAGVPFCVASNGPQVKMEVSLRSSGLMRHYGGRLNPDLIFSADDVGEPKPSPKLFFHAAAKMGFDPADCLVVDDSTQGVAGAINAGMAIVGYEDMTPASKLREAGAGIVMARLDELLALIGVGSARPA